MSSSPVIECDEIRALQDQINVLELTKRAFESDQRAYRMDKTFFNSEIEDLKQAQIKDRFDRGVDITHLYQSIGELYERMRKVEELGPVVEGHTQNLKTKTSTADRDLDRAVMTALVDRVKSLEKPWFGGLRRARVQPEADVSRMLWRMNEFNS